MLLALPLFSCAYAGILQQFCRVYRTLNLAKGRRTVADQQGGMRRHGHKMVLPFSRFPPACLV